MIENFEAGKLGVDARLLALLGGALDPDGGVPRDLRLTLSHYRTELRRAVDTMIAWQPERMGVATRGLPSES
jgi:hypothetical protein